MPCKWHKIVFLEVADAEAGVCHDRQEQQLTEDRGNAGKKPEITTRRHSIRHIEQQTDPGRVRSCVQRMSRRIKQTRAWTSSADTHTQPMTYETRAAYKLAHELLVRMTTRCRNADRAKADVSNQTPMNVRGGRE